MIRKSEDRDFESIYTVINDAAQQYKGVIPPELWKNPFVSNKYLRAEIEAGISFSVYEENGIILGVMGVQVFSNTSVIRHSYVLTSHQRLGIGSQLLKHYIAEINGPILVGCLKSMVWAENFYNKHGFSTLLNEQRDRLRKQYWNLPKIHVENSIILANDNWCESVKP